MMLAMYAVSTRADNGPVGRGSCDKWINKSGWVTWSVGQPV